MTLPDLRTLTPEEAVKLLNEMDRGNPADVLINLLCALGHGDVVEAYDRAQKRRAGD